MIALRLVNILPKFINNTQTRFIKGRYILENLITSWESMEWARHSNHSGTMLLLDFEKVYDRVEWVFLRTTLEAFGFPNEFFKMVGTLLKYFVAQVDVNEALLEEFSLERYIRQGCPLAPAIFVIALDALHYLLREHTMTPKVKGIRLSNQSEVLNI